MPDDNQELEKARNEIDTLTVELSTEQERVAELEKIIEEAAIDASDGKSNIEDVISSANATLDEFGRVLAHLGEV